MKKLILALTILFTTQLSFGQFVFNNQQVQFKDENGNHKWSIGSTGAPGNDFIFYDANSATTRISIDEDNGNVHFSNFVSIGTAPTAARLTVGGAILAKEVKVKTDVSSYPDFVFTPDYNLRSLNEVEDFINKNGHLPEIPKADEVTDGVNLGELNLKLLQKVEELTLYVIQLKKENDEIKQQLKN